MKLVYSFKSLFFLYILVSFSSATHFVHIFCFTYAFLFMRHSKRRGRKTKYSLLFFFTKPTVQSFFFFFIYLFFFCCFVVNGKKIKTKTLQDTLTHTKTLEYKRRDTVHLHFANIIMIIMHLRV